MKKKQEVIKLLEECIALESKAIPFFTRHLKSPDFFEGVPDKDADRMKRALETLAADARSHQGIFELLLARMKDPSKDGH